MTSYDILTMLLQKCTHYNDSRSLVCIGLDFPLDTLCLACWCLLLLWIGLVDLFNHQFPRQVDVIPASAKWLTATSWNATSQWTFKTNNRCGKSSNFYGSKSSSTQAPSGDDGFEGWFTSYINLNLIRCTKTWFQQTPGDAENLKYYALFRNTYIAWQEEDHQKATVVFRLVSVLDITWQFDSLILPRGLDSPSTFSCFFGSIIIPNYVTYIILPECIFHMSPAIYDTFAPSLDYGAWSICCRRPI